MSGFLQRFLDNLAVVGVIMLFIVGCLAVVWAMVGVIMLCGYVLGAVGYALGCVLVLVATVATISAFDA